MIDTLNQIRALADLAPGWYYGEGVPPTAERIGQAVTLGAAITDTRLILQSFPGIDGEIQLTGSRGVDYLEFTLEVNGQVTFVREVGDVEVDYRVVSFNEALEEIDRWAQ